MTAFQTAESAQWRTLRSALAADALDTVGHRSQCLGWDIRPTALTDAVVGRAFPVRAVETTDTHPERPYEGLLRALDDLPSGSVFVLATGRSNASGVWGELLTTACLASEVAGAVTDSLIRDVSRVLESGFPVFSRGATPYDSKGRIEIVEHGVPITVDGVVIAPGDLVVGDADGVCVIPREVEAEVLALVAEKNRGEGEFRRAVRDGMRVSDAFRKLNVL
ncbi:RraA family protein [Lentzea sp. NPDC059081]|uniref:RraA family protein n=1 Tax=Lentzea sp. NPDC059081 TaxID=3346719 RepID=UPI0036A5DD1B